MKIMMKFVSLCTMMFLIGMGVESSTVSFFTALENGRFVQEEKVMEWNATIPWVNFDLQYELNQSNCSRDIRLFIEDFQARKIWALKTFDAWGKIPSGIMQGNIYWIGSPYECGHHLRGLNSTVVEQPFRTRTCVIGNDHFNRRELVYGICVPASCNATEIFNYINRGVIHLPYIRQWIHLTNDSIQCIDRRVYDPKAILTIVILVIIAVLILLATGLHIAYGHRHGLKLEESHSDGDEQIDSQTITAIDTSITTNTVTTTTVNTSLPAEDETAPLIYRTEPAVDSVAQRLIRSCSLINNYHLFKSDHHPPSLTFLNGIRVLSLFWVIFGHTVMFAAMYSDNVMTLFNWSYQFWFQIIVQAVFSIDSFFLLSGLLTAFLYFASKVENEKFSIGKFLLNHYVYRYLRYTILYAIILLIYITISPYLGQYGPIYPRDGSESSTCRRTLWRNLLYINNFFDSNDGCMPITWFLAVNMQFHWIAPLFLLIVSWKWFLGFLVSIAFILVDIISTSVIVSKNNYDHGILSSFYLNQSNSSHNYMNDVYVKPWCRIAPYAIGLFVGYVLYRRYQHSNTLSWEFIVPERRSSRGNRVQQIVAWIFALLFISLCVFGTFGDYHDRPLTRSGRITFLVLSRIGWSIGLSIIIISCFLRQQGWVNKLLGHRCFRILGRLTYGAYLWHSLILFVHYLGRDQPVHYTIANIFFDSIVHILLSYILSFFTYLFIELPIIQLLKIVFPRRIIRAN